MTLIEAVQQRYGTNKACAQALKISERTWVYWKLRQDSLKPSALALLEKHAPKQRKVRES